MGRIVNRITGIEGVTQGGTPRVKMQVERRYHGLKFFFTVNAVAAAVTTVCDRVRLFVNGNTVRDVPASYLLDLAKLNGITPAVGELPIHFSEPWRADKIDETFTAWDMYGEGSFEFELVLKTLANPADVIGVTGLQIFDFGQLKIDGKPVKQIVRQSVLSKNAAAGQNDFDNLPKLNPLQRVHLFSAAPINWVEVEADRNKVFEAKADENTAILRDNGLTVQAGCFPVCFDFTERIDDSLVAQRSLNLRFDASAAGPVYALIESRSNGYL